MNGNYKEIRKIPLDSLRRLCIEQRWYTCGSNRDYDHLMYEMVGQKENLTTEDMAAIALDIIGHSSNLDTDDFEQVVFELTRIAAVRIEREKRAENETAKKISDLIYKTLNHMYCDNCRFDSELYGSGIADERCGGCHRKENGWAVSRAVTDSLADQIMKLQHEN
ncbi:MAG: hypothetical protein K2O18_00300 [Oscillospiraceae bacterium]|nr:hypothetical protein [Oscillospiraceae bacterium]